MHGTIVCGVADSAEGRAAPQLAAAVAARLGLRLVLVHVVARGEADEAGEPHPAEQALAEIARALDDGAETRVVHGNAVDCLAEVAAEEGADVIVLGSRSHGARGRQLGCALACELAAIQSVPVVIAPPSTHAPSRHRLGLAVAPDRR